MNAAREKIPKRIVLILFLILGLTWTWFGTLYDLRWPVPRLIVSLMTALASIALMYAGMWFLRGPSEAKLVDSALSVLPWNGLYLAQLAYIGFFFIPLEVLASTILIRKFAGLTTLKAVSMASLVRAISAGVTLLSIGWVRSSWGAKF